VAFDVSGAPVFLFTVIADDVDHGVGPGFLCGIMEGDDCGLGDVEAGAFVASKDSVGAFCW